MKPLACHGGLTALALILVDDLDLGTWPTQGHGVLDKGILASGGFAVFENLLQCGLANVDQSLTLVMLGADLGRAQ